MQRLLPAIVMIGLAVVGAGAQQVVYTPGKDVTLPTVVREAKPEYTREAMQQRIEGTVSLTLVVDKTGDVTEVAVAKSLDKEYGLDDSAVAAAKQWKFKPGTREGEPVAVRITLEMTFTLK